MLTRPKRISSPRADKKVVSLPEKGHFVIYTIDHKRFVIPLAYLRSEIFLELLKLSEEEFGLSCGEHITLPCDASFMTCILFLIKRGVAKGLHKAFLLSVVTRSCAFKQESRLKCSQILPKLRIF